MTAPAGGGASEIARVIAIHAARARRGRLTFPVQEFGGVEPVQGFAVVFGPYSACSHLMFRKSDTRVVAFANSQLTHPQMQALADRGYAMLDVPAIWRRNEDSLLVTKMIQRDTVPPGVELSSCALTLIQDYRWPGDLAHLRMTLGLAGQQAFLTGKKSISEADVLAIIDKKECNLGPLCIAEQSGWGVSIRSADMLNLAQFCGYGRVKKALERWLLEGVHSVFQGDCAAAARSLQLPYTTLVSRLKSLGISEVRRNKPSS